MQKEFLDIQEITDSIEVMYEKPNKAISLLVYLLIGLLIVALVWCCIGELDYFVKANGIVKTEQEVSNIYSVAGNKIVENYIEQGSYVEEGSLLLKYDASVNETLLEQSKMEKEDILLEIKNLEKLKQSILQGENLFDETTEEESRYYYMYEKNKVDLNATIIQYQNSEVEHKVGVNNYIENKQKLEQTNLTIEEQKKQLDLVIKYVADNTLDQVKEVEISYYYKDFVQYKSSMDILRKQINDTNAQIDKLKAESEVETVKEQIATLETTRGGLWLEVQNLQAVFLATLKENKLQLEQNIILNNQSITSTQSMIEAMSVKDFSIESIQEQSDLSIITACDSEIVGYEDRIEQLEKEIVQLEDLIDKTKVVAPISGVVNVYQPVNKGEQVGQSFQICSIVPNNSNKFRLSLYIDDKDIANVQVGQEVKVKLSALPYDEYGELSATIITIGGDSRIEQNGGVYYMAECVIEETEVTSKNGMTKEITPGMTGEMNVITDRKKIIYFLLEKLNFM